MPTGGQSVHHVKSGIYSRHPNCCYDGDTEEPQQPQPQQLLIEPLEYLSEALVAHTLDEVAYGGMVEDLVVYVQEAEPAERQIL